MFKTRQQVTAERTLQVLEKIESHLKLIADCTCDYGMDRKPFMRVQTPIR